ncbi:hypothetical protein HUJ04_001821 [Dendroctonus ponderosae]|nr:hypothetical protein HUJ04_001821 [Dendroctonus ponderosae]
MYSTMVIPFDLKGKVAIVTGGADGLGFQFALELLKKEAKARRTLDISENIGRKAVVQLNSEFGPNKAVFVKTDVTDYN